MLKEKTGDLPQKPNSCYIQQIESDFQLSCQLATVCPVILIFAISSTGRHICRIDHNIKYSQCTQRPMSFKATETGFGLLRNSSGFVILRRDKPPWQASLWLRQFPLWSSPMACPGVKKQPNFFGYLCEACFVRKELISHVIHLTIRLLNDAIFFPSISISLSVGFESIIVPSE